VITHLALTVTVDTRRVSTQGRPELRIRRSHFRYPSHSFAELVDPLWAMALRNQGHRQPRPVGISLLLPREGGIIGVDSGQVKKASRGCLCRGAPINVGAMSGADFFGLWLHVLGLAIYAGATLALLLMVLPAVTPLADPAAQRAVLARALRVYD